MRRPQWLRQQADSWASDPAAQAGVLVTASSLPGTFGRGLQPRSAMDQAIATGVVAAINYELTATTWASITAAAALRPGRRPSTKATLIVAGLALGTGSAAALLAESRADHSLGAATVRMAGRRLAYTAGAGGIATVWDHVLHRHLGLPRNVGTTLLPNVLSGTIWAAGTVLLRSRRAHSYGTVAPDRPAILRTGPTGLAQASLVGAGSALGLTALTVGEQLAAGAIEAGVARVVGRDAGAAGAFLAHSVTLGAVLVAGGLGLRQLVVRLERRDDVVEPAYPAPPQSPYVSAGPRSVMPFDTLGKEGRRFVLMALTGQDITEVMGEPAMDPVRVVGGYESASELEDRAALTLRDLEAVGGLERSLICVGCPTGVGYLNYTVVEALEYLSRGDCATIVPQYALVPSALALPRTTEGIRLTRLLLTGLRDRIALLPVDQRPRVVLLGESLGANVALDLAGGPGTPVGPREFDQLGVSGGLYLGVPFRSQLWQRWRENPDAIDPEGRLVLVSEPDEAPPAPPGSAQHLLVIHHDDPVNKFAYSMVVQRPWWLGPPATRPPLVPRETRFRTITSFVLAIVDLKNGMQSRPGQFLRRGHDYRIEARSGVQSAYGLVASADQVAAVEAALRRTEQSWAARRLVARRFAEARDSIQRTLESWGQSTGIDVADLDPTATTLEKSLVTRLGTSGPG